MATKSDFMAAEEIKAILHGRDKNEQERILRWVTESLGIAPAPGPTHTGVIPQLGGSAVSQPTAPAPASAPAATKDIKTFYKEKNPRGDVQFAAVAAYFYRFQSSQAEHKDVLVAKDLDEAGRQARGYGFKSPLTTLNNAVGLGYFDRAGRGSFKLNAVGENLVAMTLPNTGSESNGGKPRRAKRKARAKQSKAK